MQEPETLPQQQQKFHSFIESQRFDGEFWTYLQNLLASKYAVQILINIMKSHLSPDAKISLERIVFTYFDKDILLSNLKIEEAEIKTLQLKRALLIAKLSMIQNDILIPDYNEISGSIISEFEAIITRCIGPERERKMQRDATGSPDTPPQAPEQRGWAISSILPWRSR